MKLIYNTFIFLYLLSIRIAASFNQKARLWVEGRKDVFTKLENSNIIGKQIIWVHCSSLGEFEQGRPIIEELRISFPDHKILLTFFSPSGYEVRKNYEGADYISYLPADTSFSARRFVDLVKPQLAIFIKYEFWFNYIDELYNRKIPLIFASVIFRSSQHFFKPWGGWFARQLNKATFIYVQNQESLHLLDSIKIYHADVSGDTRFDRVIQLPEENVSFPIIESFKGNAKLIIGGSTWPPGEKLLLELADNLDEGCKLIIAPHLINKEHIEELIRKFNRFNPLLYSDGINEETSSKVLIIDNIGFLSLIYRYATIAYIGGGFGVGIHNVLEASTYGVPVIFGPNYKRFREAVELGNNGGGFPVENYEQFSSISKKLLSENEFYENSSAIASKYVIENSGATHMIINKVKEFIVAG